VERLYRKGSLSYLPALEHALRGPDSHRLLYTDTLNAFEEAAPPGEKSFYRSLIGDVLRACPVVYRHFHGSCEPGSSYPSEVLLAASGLPFAWKVRHARTERKEDESVGALEAWFWYRHGAFPTHLFGREQFPRGLRLY
jgi:hypothetical protein